MNLPPDRDPTGVGGVEIAAIAAAVLVGLHYVVAYVAAWVFGAHRFDGTFQQSLEALIAMPKTMSNPRQAWADPVADQLPGPVPYWGTAVVLVALAAVVGLWLVRWWPGYDRGVDRRERFGVPTQARQAKTADLSSLIVRNPEPGRLLIARHRRPLLATETNRTPATSRRERRSARRRGDRGAVIHIGPSRCGKTTSVIAGLLDPALLLVLDEAGNTPLHKLPQWASTIAGLGVQLVTVWQSKAQLDETYGRQADTILTNHLTKLFYAGLSDHSSVEYASLLLGDEFVAALLDEDRYGRRGGERRRAVTPVRLGPPHLFRQMSPGKRRPRPWDPAAGSRSDVRASAEVRHVPASGLWQRVAGVRLCGHRTCDAGAVPELAGRLYIPKLYNIEADRQPVIDLLERSIEASGGRVVYCSFRDQHVAPVYFGAEDAAGRRYGMLVYPFTTTHRATKNRPVDEHRTQIRLGDPVKQRDEENLIASDVAGVDVTLVLAADPEEGFIVGLDPLVYEDLPMGISVYYRDRHIEAAAEHGWAVWERTKAGGTRRPSWAGLETLVGFRPERLLDYVRFEAKASALGLNPALRHALAATFTSPDAEPHRLEAFFGVDAATILDIIDTNFRLGVAVRGGVAEHHLEANLAQDPVVDVVEAIDQDGQPDFRVRLVTGAGLSIECKTASRVRYKVGDFKVEVQKTRDSGAGRKYTFDQFDVVAACLFSATGVWEFRFQWTSNLAPWDEDTARIQAIQRVDETWAASLAELVKGT